MLRIFQFVAPCWFFHLVLFPFSQGLYSFCSMSKNNCIYFLASLLIVYSKKKTSSPDYSNMIRSRSNVFKFAYWETNLHTVTFKKAFFRIELKTHLSPTLTKYSAAFFWSWQPLWGLKELPMSSHDLPSVSVYIPISSFKNTYYSGVGPTLVTSV